MRNKSDLCAVGILIICTMLLSFPAVAQWHERPNSWGRMSDTLRVGDTAFDFRLRTKDGQKEIQLSSFRGRRPVVLIFGSYT